MVDLVNTIKLTRTNFISIKKYRPTVVLLNPSCIPALRTELGYRSTETKFEYDGMAVRSCDQLSFSEIEMF